MAKTANANATFIYHHDSWDPSEFVLVRAERGHRDDARIEELAQKIIVDEVVTPEKVQELTLAGEDVEKWIREHITEEQQMTTQIATMLGMIVRWTLFVDPDLTQAVLDPEGNALYNEDGTAQLEPHPLAGQPMPLDAKWLNDLPPEVIRDLWRRMNAEWSKSVRTPKQQADFRGGRVRPSQPRGGPKAQKDVSVPA